MLLDCCADLAPHLLTVKYLGHHIDAVEEVNSRLHGKFGICPVIQVYLTLVVVLVRPTAWLEVICS